MGEIKLDIMAIGVHPDDVELGCGGTLLKHVDLGLQIGVLDLTKGELGTRGSAELRMEESENARKFGGYMMRQNLGLADGFFENNRENKMAIIKVLRQYRPQVVLANAVSDRHPDHGNAAKLVYEACFLSGLKKIESTLDGKQQEKWRPRKLLNYIQDFNLEPDIVVDISGYMERKIDLVRQFASQFHDPSSDEEETPISQSDFFDFLRSRAKLHGRHIQADYGEGFTCASYLGVDNIMSLR